MPRVTWGREERRGALPAGEYVVSVKEIEIKSNVAGEEQWVLTLAVDDPGDWYGKWIKDTLTFKATCLWKIRQFVDACRTGDAVEDDQEEELEASDFLRQKIQIEVKIEKWKGEDRSKVDRFFSLEATGEEL